MQEFPNYPGNIDTLKKVKQKNYWVKKNLRYEKPERGLPFILSNLRIGNILKWLAKVLMAFLVGKLIFWDVIPQFWDSKYYMDRFTIADGLSRQGYTGEAFTKQMLYNINTVDSSIRAAPYFSQFNVVSERFDQEVHDLADVEYSGVSYRGLVNFLVNMFSPRKIIRGNITASDDGNITCQLFFPDKKFDFTERLTDSLDTSDKIYMLSNNAAYQVIARLNPVHYAILKFVNEDYHATTEFISRLDFKDLSKKERALLYMLQAKSMQVIHPQADVQPLFLASVHADDRNYLPFAEISHLQFLKGDYDSARWYINRAHERTGGDPNAKATVYNANGNLFLFRHQPDSALYYYRLGLEAEPNNFFCLWNAGVSSAEKHEYNNASAFFDSLRRHHPGRMFHNSPFVFCFGYTANTKELEMLVAARFEPWGRYKYGYFMKGKQFFDGQQMDSARYFLNQAVSLDSNFAEPIFYLGLIEGIQGNHFEAMKMFRRCLEKNGNNRDVLRAYAESLIEFGDVKGAIAVLRGGTMPHDHLLGSDLGYAEYRRGNIKRAEYFYLYSDKVNSTNMLNLQRYAALKADEGKFDDAINLSNRVLNIDANNTDALLRIAECYMQLGRYSEALKISGKVKVVNNRQPWVYVFLARQAIANAEAGKAEGYYRQVYNLDTRNIEAILYLAANTSARRKWQESIWWFKKLAQLKSLGSNELSQVGICYMNLQEYDAAIAYFKRSLFLSPVNCSAIYSWYYCLKMKNQNPFNDPDFVSAGYNSNCNTPEATGY